MLTEYRDNDKVDKDVQDILLNLMNNNAYPCYHHNSNNKNNGTILTT